MSKYIIKNCPCIVMGECNSFRDNEIFCQDCTDCVLKQAIDKLKEADNSCDGIDCTGCSGFYMCHSQFANEILKLFDIQEVE